MKFRGTWIASAMIALSMLAGATDAAERSGTKRQPPDVKLKSKKPYDQPKEALEYFAEMRLPDGAQTLDRAWYDQAIQDADQLQWHVAGTGALIPPDANVALNELSSWQQIGPANVGGRTRVIRFDPTNPQVMYIAAVAGGVWKSVNAGASWTPLSDLAPNLAISSMVIDRTNPMRIFVGTGEGVFNADAVRGNGIYVSTNGGTDFERLSSTNTADFLYVNDLVQSPNDANTLYAVTRTGAFISRDSGATWTRFIDAFAPPTAPAKTQTAGCFDIEATNNTGKDDVLVACGSFQAFLPASDSGAVYRNDDALNAGVWTPVLQPANMARTSLARSKSSPGTVYALAAGFGVTTQINDGLLGIWRSTDYGATWENRLANDSAPKNNNALLSNPVYFMFAACGYGPNQALNQGWYDNVIAVDPVDPNRIWVGGIDLWRSDDGGANFGIASYWWIGEGDPNYAHADQHVIAFHPNYDGTTNQTLYVGNDGGIQRTDNAMANVGTDATATPSNSLCGNENFPDVTWTPLNSGYAVTQFYHGSVMPNNQTYFAGAQDNGTQLGTSASLSWTEIYGGDGAYTAVNPENPQQLYLANTGFSIRRSDDGGLTSERKTIGISGDSGMFITPFLMDPNNSNRLWMGGRTMWRTDNAAELWVQASTSQMVPTTSPFTSSHRFSAQAVAPGLPDLVLSGTSQGRIYRTTAGTTATNATAWTFSPSATGATGSRVRPGAVADIAFNTAETGNDPDTRMAVAVFSAFNGGANPTDPHVFRSTNGGQTWVGIDGSGSSRLPNIPVHSVVIDPTSPGGSRIFVGTDIGVFVTTDTGATWRRENTGFANTVVEELVLQRNAVTGVLELFAFTHGRSAYKTTVAETNPPVPTAIDIAAKSATPGSLNAGSDVLLTAQITPGTLPNSTGLVVTIDLTSIGGSATTAMLDDGSNGDATAGDGLFSISHTVPVDTAAGAKALLVTARDAQGRTDTDAIALTLSPAPDAVFEDGFEDPN